MELTQDNINLIGQIVKNDRKYSGNEDLYDDFLNEACKRSASIFSAIDNEATLETYLRRVVTTSIVNVLKDSGRLRRTKTGYMSTKEVVTEAPIVEVPVKTDYSTYVVSYDNIVVPESPEDVAIKKEILAFVAETIIKIDSEEPEEQYMQIYKMRYNDGMTQKEIAQELDLSQSEISKRLYGLIEKVKSELDEQ